MKRKGYTLLELLVVVAILGILATLGSFAWSSAGARARDNERKTHLSQLENVLQQYYLEKRSYPAFDNSQLNGRLYNAAWQLSNNASSCAHSDSSTRLAPRYISEIPQDPKNRINIRNGSCSSFTDQGGAYLYLASEKSSGAPTSFALLATLENPGADELPLNQNPVLSRTTELFRDFSVGDNANYKFDSNYMITGQFGR